MQDLKNITVGQQLPLRQDKEGREGETAPMDIKLTKHRKVVYDFVNRSKNHPTANEIFEKLRTENKEISLATVYNCLEHLTEHRLIKSVHLEKGITRFCGNMTDHIHFHCTKCERIMDAQPIQSLPVHEFWNLPDHARVTGVDIAIHGECMNGGNCEFNKTNNKN
jgi:Fur family peroxide stress response transcriptional regulator